jgi:hypothetical protein
LHLLLFFLSLPRQRNISEPSFFRKKLWNFPKPQTSQQICQKADEKIPWNTWTEVTEVNLSDSVRYFRLLPSHPNRVTSTCTASFFALCYLPYPMPLFSHTSGVNINGGSFYDVGGDMIVQNSEQLAVQEHQVQVHKGVGRSQDVWEGPSTEYKNGGQVSLGVPKNSQQTGIRQPVPSCA